MPSINKVKETLFKLRALLGYLMYLNDRAYYIQSNWTVQLEKTYLSILVSATKNISTCLSIISLRLSNLFLIELMFKNEKKKWHCYNFLFWEILAQLRNLLVVHVQLAKWTVVLTSLTIFSYQTAYIQIKTQANHYHSYLIKLTLSKIAISIISTVENW